MKAVMISVQPKWCELIANGEKTIEVRKTYPKQLLDKYYKKQSDFFRNRPSYKIKPFKCYIYETLKNNHYCSICVDEYRCNSNRKCARCHRGSGKVIGEFVCDDITVYKYGENFDKIYAGSFLTIPEINAYSRGKPLYGWHISDLKIYDKPKELSEFRKGCNDSYDPMYGSYCGECDKRCRLSRPPQSWCYIESLED